MLLEEHSHKVMNRLYCGTFFCDSVLTYHFQLCNVHGKLNIIWFNHSKLILGYNPDEKYLFINGVTSFDIVGPFCGKFAAVKWSS